MEYIEIGEIVNTHGIKGYVKVNPLTDFPDRFKDMKSAVIENRNGAFNSYFIEDVIFHRNMILIKFTGVESLDEAQGLKGFKIVAERKDLVGLPEDTYYIFELIDCDVYEGNEFLGKVNDVIRTGSNDVYVVKKDDKELLIPALAWVVLNVDTANKKIEVKLPRGLKDI